MTTAASFTSSMTGKENTQNTTDASNSSTMKTANAAITTTTTQPTTVTSTSASVALDGNASASATTTTTTTTTNNSNNDTHNNNNNQKQKKMVRFPSRRSSMEHLRRISRISNYSLHEVIAVWGDKEEQMERTQELRRDVRDLSLGRQTNDNENDDSTFSTLGITDMTHQRKLERNQIRKTSVQVVLANQYLQRLHVLDGEQQQGQEPEPEHQNVERGWQQQQETTESSSSSSSGGHGGTSSSSSSSLPNNDHKSFILAKAYQKVSKESEHKARMEAIQLRRSLRSFLDLSPSPSSSPPGFSSSKMPLPASSFVLFHGTSGEDDETPSSSPPPPRLATTTTADENRDEDDDQKREEVQDDKKQGNEEEEEDDDEDVDDDDIVDVWKGFKVIPLL